METTKLNTVDYELEGRVYRLSCNMNVIAYVQDEYDGNLLQALDRVRGIKSTLAFLAGMLTDAADSQGIKDENGLPLVFTRKQLIGDVGLFRALVRRMADRDAQVCQRLIDHHAPSLRLQVSSISSVSCP
jgi:hypothetical protein